MAKTITKSKLSDKKRKTGKLSKQHIKKSKKNGGGDGNTSNPTEQNMPGDSWSQAESVYEVEKITAHKLVKNKIKFQVKWDGYPDSENTWEEFQFFSTDAPELVEEYIKRHIFFTEQQLNQHASQNNTEDVEQQQQQQIQIENSDSQLREINQDGTNMQIDQSPDNLAASEGPRDGATQINDEKPAKSENTITINLNSANQEGGVSSSDAQNRAPTSSENEFQRPIVVTRQKDEDNELQNQSDVTLTENTPIKVLFQFEYGVTKKKNGFLITIEGQDNDKADNPQEIGNQNQIKQLVSEERLLKTHSKELYYFLKQKLCFESYPVSKQVMMSFSNENEIESYIGQTEQASEAQSSVTNMPQDIASSQNKD